MKIIEVGMRRLMLPMLLFLFGFNAASVAEGTQFWTYQEYMRLNPQQAEHAKAFDFRVQGAAEPLNNIQKTVRIAVVYPGEQVSDYWRRSVSSFSARLQELQIPHEITPYFSAPGVNLRLQERQISQALALDPDYLIFTLDASRHRTIIERIIARARPKLILQNITTPVRDWAQNQPFMYVGFDHVEGSLILAEKYLSLFPSQTPYIMLMGPRGYVSHMRGNSFSKAVAQQKKFKAVSTYFTDFDREKSRTALLDALKRGIEVPFVFACSTDIAFGVMDGLKEAGRLGDIIVNGWGGGERELQAVQDGTLDFTVMRMNDDNGVAMAEGIALDLIGRGDEVPTIYSGDMVLVERNMEQSEINKLVSRAFRYSSGPKAEPLLKQLNGG